MLRFVDHTQDTHKLLCTTDHPVAETAKTTQQTRQTKNHSLSRIQTRDPINQAAGDLRLRPHGIFYVFMLQITDSPHLHCRSLLQYVSKGYKNLTC